MAWTLEEAITQLEDVADVPPKQRRTSVAELAEAIADSAHERGLTTELLGRIISVIVKSKHLDQTTVTSIIKNLYPSERVPSRIISRIICSLGPTKTKPSPATQSLLLRWILLVYDSLEDESFLSRAYNVFFDNLEMISLRRPLCHLLSLITRRKHVKPYRIAALMELIRNMGGDERELWGLLRVFKSYYPDIILDDTSLPTRRANYFFKHPDQEWTKHMKVLQEKTASNARLPTREKFQIVRRDGVKRTRVEIVIPVSKTVRVKRGHTSFEELRDARDFINKLDKIELPNQIASALVEPLVQKYLLLVENTIALRRMDSWLASLFQDELDRIQVGDEDTLGQLGYVLDILVQYVRYTKKLPESLDNFLQSYLLVWNGDDNRMSVLELLEYLPIQDYDTLCRRYLLPLERALLDNSLESKTLLLRLYGNLVQNYGCAVRTNPTLGKGWGLTGIINRAEVLALAILESQDYTGSDEIQPSGSWILQFYLQLAHIYAYATTHESIRLNSPVPQTVYILTFTPVLSHISLASAVVARYKSAFEQSLTITTFPNGAENEPYPNDMVTRFNGHVLDLCNLLWRNRGLNNEEPNALGCLMQQATTKLLTDYVQEVADHLARKGGSGGHYKLRLPSIFSMSHNIALCGISAACFRALELKAENDGEEVGAKLAWPVMQKALIDLNKAGGIKANWQDYRLEMLNWLDEHGSTGIGRLMRSSMMTLRQG
ncbi:hypothetical protein FQN57_002353 [Myotisia sp. PD_48]|nr:hypothetical protein FQN57_002353 [Myotisia sp. PD_48]